jgi:fatty-acyl-CoA synthase
MSSRLSNLTGHLAALGQSPNHSQLDPLAFLHRSTALFPTLPAILHDNVRLSYKQFNERVLALTHALLGLHLPPGSRIAYMCWNDLPMYEAHFGVLAAQHILVAINTRVLEQDVAYILQHSGASVFVVEAELKHLIPPLEGVRVIVVGQQGPQGYDAFLASGNQAATSLGWAAVPPCADENATATICYTSGTTGRPKGVMLTRRGAYLAVLSNIIHARLDERSVFLWTLPMFHCNGWTFVWATIAAGACNIMLPKIDYDKVWKHLIHNKVTHYNAAPTVQIAVVNHPHARKLDTLVRTTVAGSPPTPTVIAKLRSLNIEPIHVYGLTETYGPCTICQWQPDWDTLAPQQLSKLVARQGHGYIANEQVRVVDEHMNTVPSDGKSMGEVVFRGNIVMKGYYNDPDATAKAFKGGWFHSGDVAVCHPDGYIELKDRSKDIIISGGENISTIELENYISKHDNVLECAVIGIPHDTWGETPKAFVVVKTSRHNMDREIIEYCKKGLAGFKRPRHVEIVQELPKTSTGKIQKYVLKNKAWKGQARIH